MSAEFASLRDALDALQRSQDEYARTVSRFVAASDLDSREQWQDIAELRDDVNGLSNRLETLMQAVLASPSDVAGAIIRLHDGGEAA